MIKGRLTVASNAKSLQVRLVAAYKTEWAVVFALIAIAYAITISDFWGVRFTTADDSRIASESFVENNEAWRLATEQGRLYFFHHFPVLEFVLHQWRTSFYDWLHYGTYFLALLIFATSIAIYGGCALGVSFVLIYLATLAGVWEHALITSVPFYHFFVLIVFSALIVSIAMARVTGRTGWIVAAVFAFLYVVVGHEYQVIYGVAAVVIAGNAPMIFNNHPRWGGCKNKLYLSVIVLTILYVACLVVWRAYWGTIYSGADVEIDKFDVRTYLNMVVTWSFSDNVVYRIVKPYAFRFSVDGVIETYRINYDLLSAIRNIEIVSALRGVFLGFVGCIVTERKFINKFFSRAAVWQMLCLGAIIVFTPSVLLAMTTKYSEWYKMGVETYTYSSISNFGAVLIIATLWLTALAKIRIGPIYVMFRCVTIVALVCLSLLASIHNHVVGNGMREATTKWKVLDMMFMLPESEQFSGAAIYGNRMGNFIWSVPTPAEYWREFIKNVYKVDVNFILDKRNLQGVGGKIYYVDPVYLPNMRGGVGILSQATSDLYSDEFVLFSENPLNISVTYRDRKGGVYRVFPTKVELNTDRIGTQRVHSYRVRGKDIELSTIQVVDALLVSAIDLSPPIVEFDVPIFFGKEGKGARYQVAGWSVPEDGHTWGMGNNSSLNFIIEKDVKCDVGVFIDGWVFEDPKNNVKPVIDILVNGMSVWSASVDTREGIRFRIPNSVLKESEFITVEIQNDMPASPHSVDQSGDRRLLSLAVKSVTFLGCRK